MSDEIEKSLEMPPEPTFRPATGYRFDRTITAGNVLVFFGGLVALMGAYVDYARWTDRMETRVKNDEQTIAELKIESASQAKTSQETNLTLREIKTILQMEHRAPEK